MNTFDLTTIQPYRFRHTHIIGQTGTGKSTLLQQLILNDIENDHGVLFIDPHGHDTNTILEQFPKRREDDLIVFDVSDYDFPIAFNPLQAVPEHRRPFVASSNLDTAKDSLWGFKKNFSASRVELIVYHCIASLLDVENGTLLGIPLMLSDEKRLKAVIKRTSDPMVRRYWKEVFLKIPNKRDRATLIESTFGKFQYFLADPHIRHCLGQAKSAFDLRDVLKGKILFARLPQGKLGLQKTKMMGSLLLSAIHNAALSREDDNPFHIYIDEADTFAGNTVTEMLSGIRKFSVSITIAHQFIQPELKDFNSALFGNCGTTIAFRTGIDDAEYMKNYVPNDNTVDKLYELPLHEALVTVPDFSIQKRYFYSTVTMPKPDVTPNPKRREKLLSKNRIKYASPREHVAAKINSYIENA